MRLSQVDCGPSELVRTSAAARADSVPTVLFVTHRAGVARVEQGGRQSIQRPGQSVLYLTHRPYKLSFPTSIRERVLSFPARRLTIRPADLDQLSARSLDPTP